MPGHTGPSRRPLKKCPSAVPFCFCHALLDQRVAADRGRLRPADTAAAALFLLIWRLLPWIRGTATPAIPGCTLEGTEIVVLRLRTCRVFVEAPHRSSRHVSLLQRDLERAQPSLSLSLCGPSPEFPDRLSPCHLLCLTPLSIMMRCVGLSSVMANDCRHVQTLVFMRLGPKISRR